MLMEGFEAGGEGAKEEAVGVEEEMEGEVVVEANTRTTNNNSMVARIKPVA